MAKGSDATEVHVNRDHTAHARERDRNVYELLADHEIELVGHTGISCAEPATIQTKEGEPYKVLTPFYRAWVNAERRELAKRSRKLSSPTTLQVGRPPVEDEMGIDAEAKRKAEAFWPGEEASRRRMHQAVRDCDDYEDVRNDAGADATTKLSPALHFGTVSARELEELLLERGSKGAREVRRQICWRDFWLNVIRQAPGNRTEEFKKDLRGISWRWSEQDLDAWKRGRTGIPWVAAGMRQLAEQGWMHNRVRMAVASFLTKNLLIDWRLGEEHFMEHLLDGRRVPEQRQLAVVGVAWRRSSALLPRFQSGPSAGALRPRWHLRPPLGARVARDARRLSVRALGGAGRGAGAGRVRDRHRLPGADGRPEGVAPGGDREVQGRQRLNSRPSEVEWQESKRIVPSFGFERAEVALIQSGDVGRPNALGQGNEGSVGEPDPQFRPASRDRRNSGHRLGPPIDQVCAGGKIISQRCRSLRSTTGGNQMIGLGDEHRRGDEILGLGLKPIADQPVVLVG